ncbi:hypothetical protein [Fodinicurvata sp. EGI_FJ10296]|uniref:hypothetical protein n=1 Tax=Fodinicurvata sp. EGI_FJ10296 TaxID=3231908 RepID=UPI003451E1F0
MARNRNRSVFSQGGSNSGIGGRILRMLLAVILLALVGGVVFLGIWDFQPERTVVERPVSAN